MPKTLTDSRFNMWRAVVAMVHADGVVTPHEIDFVNGHILNLTLSAGQMQVIHEDMRNPQDVQEMFLKITAPLDKKDFFSLARALSWCDGDMDKQEAAILDALHLEHMEEKEHCLLRESYEIMEEVELCHNQWEFKTERSKNLLGFLNNLKST